MFSTPGRNPHMSEIVRNLLDKIMNKKVKVFKNGPSKILRKTVFKKTEVIWSA